MDSFEWNKIAGAVLGTLIFIFVIRLVAEGIYEPEKPAKPGYVVQGVVETAAGGAPAAPVEEPIPDWGTVLPAADVAAGKTISARCEQCHDTSSAKTIKIGPPLYGVVGRARATVAGFDYSSAMKSKGGSWTFDELFKFTKSPQAYIQGTKMSFAGLSSAKDRINLIAFLRTNTDSPVAIPAPAPAKPVASAAAATTPAATATTGKADATGTADKPAASTPAADSAAPAPGSKGAVQPKDAKPAAAKSAAPASNPGAGP
jgi:cytochrome c